MIIENQWNSSAIFLFMYSAAWYVDPIIVYESQMSTMQNLNISTAKYCQSILAEVSKLFGIQTKTCIIKVFLI